jgi:hypothetical protein
MNADPQPDDRLARAVKESKAPAISRAAAVLRLLGKHDAPLGLQPIARELGLVPSTCLYVLRALVAEGLVAFDPDTKRYALDAGVLTLARQWLRRDAFADLAQPALDKLAQRFGVTMLGRLARRHVSGQRPGRQPLSRADQRHRPLHRRFRRLSGKPARSALPAAAMGRSAQLRRMARTGGADPHARFRHRRGPLHIRHDGARRTRVEVPRRRGRGPAQPCARGDRTGQRAQARPGRSWRSPAGRKPIAVRSDERITIRRCNIDTGRNFCYNPATTILPFPHAVPNHAAGGGVSNRRTAIVWPRPADTDRYAWSLSDAEGCGQ